MNSSIVIILTKEDAISLSKGNVSDRVRLSAETAARSHGAKESSVVIAVATSFGVSVTALKGLSRETRLVRPRKVATWLLRRVCQLSWASIGRELGQRHHTTAIHAYTTCQDDKELMTAAREIAKSKGWSVRWE